MKMIIALLEKILFQLMERNRRREDLARRLDELIDHRMEKLSDQLDEIIELLSPSPAASFHIGLKLQKGDAMKASDVQLDFTVFENGQATATLTPIDKNGNAVVMPAGASVPVWSSSDPSITVSASADGLSALLTAGKTPVTAATVSATATLADGTTIAGTTDPIDVVAQPPGSATAFKIALSAQAQP